MYIQVCNHPSLFLSIYSCFHVCTVLSFSSSITRPGSEPARHVPFTTPPRRQPTFSQNGNDTLHLSDVGRSVEG